MYFICDLELTSAVKALQSFRNIFGVHWEDGCERELRVNVKQISAEHYLDPDMVRVKGYPMQVTSARQFATCFFCWVSLQTEQYHDLCSSQFPKGPKVNLIVAFWFPPDDVTTKFDFSDFEGGVFSIRQHNSQSFFK